MGGSELGFGDQKELGAGQGERRVPPGGSSSSQGAVCRSRSRLFIQSSGCGHEIVPSFPRVQRPEVTGLRKVGPCPPGYRWNDLSSIYEIWETRLLDACSSLPYPRRPSTHCAADRRAHSQAWLGSQLRTDNHTQAQPWWNMWVPGLKIWLKSFHPKHLVPNNSFGEMSIFVKSE